MTSWQNKQPFQRVLVIGLGLMGGSFVKQLQGTGVAIFGIDKDASTLAQITSEQEINIITVADLATLPKMDLVIVTLMPSLVAQQFSELAAYLTKETLVIDISGVKQGVVAALSELSLPFSYVLTHPMAGREKGGYAGSVYNLFVDANFLLITDGMQVETAMLNSLIAFIHWLGTDKITYMSAEEHDQHITYTSQLSHVLASSLLLSADYTEKTKDTIGDSFRDLTRIANMNIPMWSELFIENSDLLALSIDHLMHELAEMKQLIVTADKITLSATLAVGKARRASFGSKQK